MRTPYFTALLGIAFIAPTIASAQTTPPAPPAPQGGYGMRDPLARLDTNGDGIITRAEIMANADRRFDRLDTNHDGKVTQDEIQARMAEMGRGPAAGAMPPPPPPADGSAPPPPPPGAGRFAGRMGMAMFRRADANSDGVVTREEYRAAEAQRFAMMDANHDGTIDANERAAAEEAMGQRMGRFGGGRRRAEGADGQMAPAPAPSSPSNGQ